MTKNPVPPEKPFVYAFGTPRLVLLACIILALITFSLMLGIRIERYQQTSSVAGYETIRELAPKTTRKPMKEIVDIRQEDVEPTTSKPAPLQSTDSATEEPGVQPASAKAPLEKESSQSETKPAEPAKVSASQAEQATPSEKPQVKKKTSATRHYAVQVLSSQDKTKSLAIVDLLNKKGLTAYLEEIDLGAKGLFYRIMVGPFETEKEAKKVQSQLAADSKYPGAYIRYLP